MTSSAIQDFLHEIIHGDPIPADKLAYFGATLCGLFHQAILIEFSKAEEKGLTKAALARRIGKKPEQITRWLSYPGNLTLDTIAEIFVGMGIEVEKLGLANLASGERVEFPEPEETVIPEAAQIVDIEGAVVPFRPVGGQHPIFTH